MSSRDGSRVYYLLSSVSSQRQDGIAARAELRSVDLASGKIEGLLPGFSVTDYDVSHDDKNVAFTTIESNGESTIWLASLDRRTPPRQITRAGDQVSFGANGELVFRLLEDKRNFVGRINTDGNGRGRVSDTPILNKLSVSPDGEWVAAFVPGTGDDASGTTGTVGTVAMPVHGGMLKRICGASLCTTVWSSDGRMLYVTVSASATGRTLAIPVPAGTSLPELPAAGISLTAGGVEPPGTLVIQHGAVSPGPDPSVYVFTKANLQRNLFRIPLH